MSNMETFNVSVTRIGYASMDIEVQATDYEAAVGLALDEAPSLDFSKEHSSDYFLEEELPSILPEGHTSISSLGMEYLETVFGHIREFEADDFYKTCNSSGTLEDGHILYATLLAELSIKGSIEWDGETVSSEDELRKLMTKQYIAWGEEN